MNDLNNITIIGRLTRDAEIKVSQNGTQIIEFTVANNYSRKNINGQWEELVSFFSIKFFGGNDVFAYLIKGKQVAIKGVLRQERWIDNVTNKNQSRIIIIAEKIQLLSQGVNNNTNNGSSNDLYHQQAQYQPKQPELQINSDDSNELDFDDSIPF